MTHHSVNIFFKILFKKIALNSAFWNKLYPPYCSYVFLLQITKDRCSDFNQQRPPLTEGGLPVLYRTTKHEEGKLHYSMTASSWIWAFHVSGSPQLLRVSLTIVYTCQDHVLESLKMAFFDFVVILDSRYSKLTPKFVTPLINKICKPCTVS